MGGLLNPSFEVDGGLPAVVNTPVAPPYQLQEAQVLRCLVDGAPYQQATITKGSLAVVFGGVEPYVLVDGTGLDLTLDGALYNVPIAAVDFDDIGAALALEVATVISAAVGPAAALGFAAGVLSVGSPTTGSGGSVSVAGSAAAPLGLDGATSTGIDYFADLALVSAAELVAFIGDAFDPLTVTVSEGDGGRPTFTTVSEGDDATLLFDGPLAQVLGLPVGVVRGASIAGGAAYWEVTSSSITHEFGAWLDFPIETFSVGWSPYVTLSPIPAFGPDDVELGLVESFGPSGWVVFFSALGPTTVGLAEVFDWSLLETPTYSAGVTENFTGWASFSDALGPTDDAEFVTPGGPVTEETFGDDANATLAQYVAEWTSAIPPAGTYYLNVGGVVYKVVTAGATIRALLSVDFATQINASADGTSAEEQFGALWIWRPDFLPITVVPEAQDGAPTNELVVHPAATAPSIAGYWTGVKEY